MIAQLISNAAATTKVRAKMRGRLMKEDYDKLMVMRSVPEIAIYLKEHTRYIGVLKGVHVEEIHRGKLEAILKSLIVSDLISLNYFSATMEKFFLKLYVIRDEIENLKIFLRLLYSHHSDMFKIDSDWSIAKNYSIDFEKLSGVKNFRQFVDALEHTPYHIVFNNFLADESRQNLFNLEFALDTFYTHLVFKYTKNHLTKNEQKIVEKTFGTETDLFNMSFIIRSKTYYNFKPEQIYPLLIEKRRRLKKSDITAMVEANSIEEVMNAAKSTAYGEIFKDGNDDRTIERKIQSYVLDMHKRIFVAEPYTVEAALGYLHIKETEIRNIITIVEGIRYRLPMDKVRENIIGYNG